MTRPVYKALHAPCLVFGVDRRLLAAAVGIGLLTMNVTQRMWLALVVAGAGYGVAFLFRHEPHLVPMIRSAWRVPRRLDAVQHGGASLQVRR